MTLNRLQQSCNSKCSFDIYSKNIGMNNSSININGGNGTITGSTAGDIGLAALDSAMSIFSMAMIAKMASGQTVSSPKNVSSDVSNAIATLPGKISNSITSFNTTYNKAGINMSPNGVLDKTYTARETELNNLIKACKAEIIADKETGAVNSNYEKYSNIKTTISNLKSAKTIIASYDTQMNNIKETGDIEISNGKAVPRKLNNTEMQNCKDACNNGQDYTTTNTYKDIMAGLQAKADSYNAVLKSKQDALDSLTDSDGNPVKDIDKAIDDETKKLSVADKPVKGGKTCSQHDKNLAFYESQLAALGTKEEFEGAVDAIKKLKEQLSNALQVRKEEVDVDEANNQVKKHKKGGSLLNKLFGRKSQANKDARANRATQITQRNAAYAAYAEKWIEKK